MIVNCTYFKHHQTTVTIRASLNNQTKKIEHCSFIRKQQFQLPVFHKQRLKMRLEVVIVNIAHVHTEAHYFHCIPRASNFLAASRLGIFPALCSRAIFPRLPCD